MKKRKQQSVLRRRQVSQLSPQLEALETLLRQGPKTIKQLAAEMPFKPEVKSDRVALIRSCLSQLGKLVPITVNFRYGASTYEILHKESTKPS